MDNANIAKVDESFRPDQVTFWDLSNQHCVILPVQLAELTLQKVLLYARHPITLEM